MITVTIPMAPESAMMPNQLSKQAHWSKRAKVRRDCREIARYAAMASGMHALTVTKFGILAGTKYANGPAMLPTSEAVAKKGLSSMQNHSTKNGHPRWTSDEDAYITENFQKITIKEMAEHLGRTVGAVRNRRLYIGVSGTWKFEWTPEKESVLIDAYKKRDIRDSVNQNRLAETIGCSRSAIQRRARELNLTGEWVSAKNKDGRFPSQNPKYATEEDRRAAQSVRVRALWKSQPHPRGATGMKHTSKSRAEMGSASRTWWDSQSPEQRTERGRRAAMTRFKRYGTSGPVNVENPYSRARGGKREDLDNQYFRSSWEANYARYLNWLVQNGEIQGWEYEADTFVFEGYTRGAMTYRPDFKVTENDGRVVFHEVKGWMDGPSKTRLKRMAKHYPEVKVIVIGEDEYKAIRKWSGLIPGWE